jgi:hypothetical protein
MDGKSILGKMDPQILEVTTKKNSEKQSFFVNKKRPWFPFEIETLFLLRLDQIRSKIEIRLRLRQDLKNEI